MLYFIILTFFLLRGTESQMWECSPLVNGRYYFPNINVAPTSDLTDSGQSYVYPIPTNLGCTGTVTAVEFCYGIHNSDTRSNKVPAEGYMVFTLSTWNPSGSSFTVKDSIQVYSDPSSIACDSTSGGGRVCCDTVPLVSADQFQLPADNVVAIGVTIPPVPTATLQILTSMDTVTVFQQQISPVRGMTYNLGDATTGQFQALRLHLTPLPITSIPTALPNTLPTNPTALPKTIYSYPPTSPTGTPPATQYVTLFPITSPPTALPITLPTNPTALPNTIYTSYPPTSPLGTPPAAQSVTPPTISPTAPPTTPLTTPPTPPTTLPALQPTTPPPTLPNTSSITPPITSYITPPTTPPMSQTSTVNALRLSTVVGEAIGGIIAVLLTIIMLLVLFVILVMNRRQRTPKRNSNKGKNDPCINKTPSKTDVGLKKDLSEKTKPEKTTSFIVTIANKAYSSARHTNTVDVSNISASTSGHIILTEANQAYASSATCMPYYEEIDATLATPDPIVRTQTNVAYNCNGNVAATNILPQSAEFSEQLPRNGTYVEYLYVDPPVTIHTV